MRPGRVDDTPLAPRPRSGRTACAPAARSTLPALQQQEKNGAPPIHSFTTTTSSAATAAASAPWLLAAVAGAAEVADSCSKARLVSAYVDPNPTPAPKPIVVALDAPPPVNPSTHGQQKNKNGRQRKNTAQDAHGQAQPVQPVRVERKRTRKERKTRQTRRGSKTSSTAQDPHPRYGPGGRLKCGRRTRR